MPTKSKKTRTYDVTSRQEASADNRQAIITALVDLLCEKQGGEVQISEVAKRSKMSERSIFRFFKDKPALFEATSDYMSSYLRKANANLRDATLHDFVTQTFKVFDEHSNLVMAYLFSQFGLSARSVFRKNLNELLLAKLVAERSIQPTSENREKLAFIVSLMSARIWYEMKTDFDMSGRDSGQIVAWAMDALIASLK